MWELYHAWDNGTLPRRIDYGQNDEATVNMRDSGALRRRMAEYRKRGCPGSYDFDIGHFEAAFESLDNAMIGPWNPTQFQVGGFHGTATKSPNGSVTYVAENGMTNSSFIALNTIADTLGIGKPGARDDPNGPNGPKHNVQQVFTWRIADPCTIP